MVAARTAEKNRVEKLLEDAQIKLSVVASDIAALDSRIDAEISPFAAAVGKLDEIPGISLAAAHAILAETGPGMTRFPTAGHLCPGRNTRRW